MLFTFAMGLMGTFYPGMKVNPLDLSPNYAGTLMAITNGIGAITGIIAPYVVGVMTPNVSYHDRKHGRCVFVRLERSSFSIGLVLVWSFELYFFRLERFLMCGVLLLLTL